MIRKLIKLVDARGSNEIHLGNNFLIDDVHDTVDDEEGDEGNEEEGEGEFPGERHPFPDVGTELVGHLVDLVHFDSSNYKIMLIQTLQEIIFFRKPKLLFVLWRKFYHLLQYKLTSE